MLGVFDRTLNSESHVSAPLSIRSPLPSLKFVCPYPNLTHAKLVTAEARGMEQVAKSLEMSEAGQIGGHAEGVKV